MIVKREQEPPTGAYVELILKGQFRVLYDTDDQHLITPYKWTIKKSAHVSSLLYYNGHVYMIRDGGIISCFDSESGKLVYREKSGATGAYFSSPVASDGRIMIASRNGIVTIFDSGDNFKILAQNNLEENITATPAIVDSKIYLRTAEFLYAFGER